MKRVFSFLIVFIVLFNISACGNSDTTSKDIHKIDAQTTNKVNEKQDQKNSEKQNKEVTTNKNTAKKNEGKQTNKNSTGKKKSTKESTHKSAKASHKSAIPSDLIPATVSKNVDGDTIHVTLHGKDENIRMLLIDTPEDVHPSKPVEPYGREAASYAEKKLPVGKKIYIKPGIEKRDKYGRLLAYVFVTPSDMYNFDVVKKGLARVGYVYNDTTYLSKLRAAQSDAKEHKRGIWSIPGYVDNEHDTYNLKIACNWAAKHHESTRGCSDSTKSTGSHTATHSGGSGSSSSSSHAKGCNIKGSSSHIYHLPGDPWYDRTTHVVKWFCSEKEAKQAGFRPPKR